MSLAHDPTADDPFTVDLDAKGLQSRAAMGSVLSGGAQIAKMLIQLGSAMVLGRLLFPSDFGLIAMVYPVVGFIQLFGNLGFGEAIVQRPELRHADVSSLFWLNLAIGVGLALVGAALSPVTAWMYGEPQVTRLMAVIAAILPLSALGAIHGAILSRQMRFGVMARNELTVALLGVVVTIGCAFLNMGYWSMVVGQAAATVTGTGLAWISISWRPSRPALTGQVWHDVKFGANLTGAGIATFLASSGDNIIIGTLNGKLALGIYDRGYRLVVQPLGQMLAPLSLVALPLLSRLQADPAEYRKVYLNFLRLILLFNVPITLICIANPREVVTLLLGPRWQEAAIPFAWISVGGMLSGFYSSLPWLFVSQARTRSMLAYMGVAAIFNLASFAVGAIWGIVGVAACAALVFVLFTAPLVTYGATRTGPVSLRDVVMCCLPYALTGTMAFLLTKLVAHVWPDEGWVRLFVSIVLCILTFGVMALVAPGERQMVQFVWARLDKFKAKILSSPT